tara:strand:- start:4105 stop:4509 length:405 start_codon:yes stop_codon:yes gene_type:complete
MENEEENINIKYTLKEYEKKFGWVKDKEILDCIEEKEEKMKQKINIQDQENYSTIFFILEEDYMNNYNKKDLELIADYYGISKRKKKKQDLVQDIIIFEQDYMNEEVVEKRKLGWYCIDQIKNDDKLKRYINIY